MGVIIFLWCHHLEGDVTKSPKPVPNLFFQVVFRQSLAVDNAADAAPGPERHRHGAGLRRKASRNNPGPPAFLPKKVRYNCDEIRRNFTPMRTDRLQP